MSESELPVTHRNSEISSKPKDPHTSGQAYQTPDYRVSDGRCKGSMIQSQAHMRNTGTCYDDGKEKWQTENTVSANTDASCRDGASRSSDETPVMGDERRARIDAPREVVNSKEEELKLSGKCFDVSKREVWEAFKQVKANKGSAGIDGQTLLEFESTLKGNLYKIWNRLRAGSYFPPAVKEVSIPKKNGGTRILGVPTISDRVAQAVVKNRIECEIDKIFHPDSYGYRPNKSALMAIEVTRKRCWKSDWIVEFDIKGAFDNIDHEYLMVLVRRHVSCPWTVRYLERWLKAGPLDAEGNVTARTRGTPQGGIVSPLLMNLYMHYTFDKWMQDSYPGCEFARYADDAVIHCRSLRQAEMIMEQLKQRLQRCRLEIHPDKSKIVYCRDSNRTGSWENTSFNFLGFCFRPRKTLWKTGYATSFLPAASSDALAKMRSVLKQWKISRRVTDDLKTIANDINPIIRGWYGYYASFGRSVMNAISYGIDRHLAQWVRRKLLNLRRRKRASAELIKRIRKSSPKLFAHWAFYEKRREIASMGAV